VAVIGGTGNLGYGLAVRLAKPYSVNIASRDPQKAEAAAAKATQQAGADVEAGDNVGAAAWCEIAILAVPDLPSSDFLASLAPGLEGKLVISPIVPMTVKGGVFMISVAGDSAAERVAKALPGSRVASAFQTVPSPMLAKLDEALDYDVLVTADSKEVYLEAAKVVSSIGKLRPLYAGPLAVSRQVEGITPAILNAMRFNKLNWPSIKLV
jgi:hypothetical protein